MTTRRGRLAALLLVAAVAVGAVGCGSPEARRARGKGPGADVGNRRDPVRIHDGADPYHETPRVLPRART